MNKFSLDDTQLIDIKNDLSTNTIQYKFRCNSDLRKMRCYRWKILNDFGSFNVIFGKIKESLGVRKFLQINKLKQLMYGEDYFC